MLSINDIKQLSAQGRHAEAMAAATKLVKQNPNATSALSIFAFVHLGGGQYDKALKVYKRLIGVNPAVADYHFNMAICLVQKGALDQGEVSYLKVISLQPDNFAAHMNIGVLYRQKAAWSKSVDYLEKAIELAPHHAEAVHNLAITYEQQKKFDRALELYDQVLDIDPKHFRALGNKGAIYSELNTFAPAKEAFEASLAIAPDYVNSLNNLGLVHLYESDLNAASGMFKQAMEKHPRDGKGYFNLSNLTNLTGDDIAAAIERLEGILNDKGAMANREMALFALAQFHEKSKNTHEMRRAYHMANAAVARLRPYDNHKTEVNFKKIADFNAALPASDAAVTADKKRIFIIGMPRSGTTLLESILASHDDITAGDELTFFNAACETRLGLSAQDVSADIVAGIRAEYEEKTAALFAGKSWLIDKLPHNFKWAEAISKVFPDARILHCHRDPMDNCWSIFRTNFEYTHNYSFSMKSIGQYYARYQQLMGIHERRIGEAMLAVNYDALVQHPETETSRIFNFLGLEARFDDDARNRGYFSRTASSAQVQAPISTASLQGWRKHEDFLKPMLAALQKQQQRLGLPLYDVTGG